MPIPLILWGLGAAAVAGLGLGAKAAYDNSEANDANDNAASIFASAENKLNDIREQTNISLEDYGSKKLNAFQTKIGKFVSLFEQLQNIEIEKNPELDRLQLGDSTNISFANLKESYNAISCRTSDLI